MINYIRVKTTLLPRQEVNIDFYDIQENFIGNIDVSILGKVSWSIADMNYEAYIMPVINYIMGENSIKKLYHVTKDEKIERWKNTWEYINYRGLIVNIKNDNNLCDKTKKR